MRVFQGEIRIWISRLSKEDLSASYIGGHPTHWGPKRKMQVEEEWTFSLCLNQEPHVLLLDRAAPGSQTFIFQDLHKQPFSLLPTSHSFPHLHQARDSDQITPLAFLVLQLLDSRWWDFLAPITVWANYYNKYAHIYSICSISLENPYWYSVDLFIFLPIRKWPQKESPCRRIWVTIK